MVFYYFLHVFSACILLINDLHILASFVFRFKQNQPFFLFKTSYLKREKLIRIAGIFLALIASIAVKAQMITGIWQGKINRQKVEVKFIQQGDSLTGTSYYYESPTHYRRYGIKGYFDPNTNEAVWWDDHLIEEKTGSTRNAAGKMALLSRADFNCPGEGKMMLDGKAGKPEDENPKGDVHLDKTVASNFPDDWDYVINNYLTGGNDPDLIAKLSARDEEEPVTEIPAPILQRPRQEPVREPVTLAPPVVDVKIDKPAAPLTTIEQKFTTRKKVLVKEIPLVGDSVELQFYDNAEIDGDSISLFLNDRLIFQHIRLLGSAYTIKLPVKLLEETNELTMVAENLGSIPPNTSYMIALVGDKRYDARLESTEGSSAMIRFVKTPTQ